MLQNPLVVLKNPPLMALSPNCRIIVEKKPKKPKVGRIKWKKPTLTLPTLRGGVKMTPGAITSFVT